MLYVGTWSSVGRVESSEALARTAAGELGKNLEAENETIGT
jgi:hypothetical protein